MELMARVGSGEDRGFTKCRGTSRSCCNSRRDVPGTYAPDPYRFVSSISCSRCGSLYYNRLHHDQRFLFDFRAAHFPPQQYERKLVQATKARESALRMLSWKEQKITREQLELKAHSGSIEDWKAYILWEKKGKKVQSRLMPVLYECAIECAASERWAAICAEDETRLAGAEAALRGFWEDYLGFQVGEVR